MILCITEKPSVGADIAKILGAGVRRDGYFEGDTYCVTWTFGHLCELKDPSDYTSEWKRWSLSALPMIPPRFGIKLKDDKGIQHQFEVIEKLIKRCDKVINCGDAGQEGELIQRWVMQKAGCDKPVERLWISSLTDESIREGFNHLRPEKELECKFGIEYVDDPQTGKKVPTCHRTSVESIFDDDNYEQAKEYADAESRDIFHTEAKEIDRIQQGILNIVKNEPPYDVFICYKETDAEGQRTKDSVMAQDIYNALIREDYKVFFSRITLEGMLGQQYEPYIFAALSSAKVMLVVGTHREHFEAVWVKNEWSRFIDMMKTDKSKVLIPCYADIDAYDMPREFKNIQGQDMGKVGFIQDLVRGIGKIIPKQQAAAPAAVIAAPTTSNVPALLERTFMFLGSSDWDSADSYCERILDLDPKCGKAYLGKLLVEYRCRREDELDELSTDITESQNYRNAVNFGCDLKSHATKALYNRGCKLLEASETIKQLSAAKSCFEQTDGFEDSSDKHQTAADKLDKAKALAENCRTVLRRYDDEKKNTPNAEPLNRVINAKKDIKTKWPKFSGDEVPAPFSPAKMNVWFIPIGIGLIAFAVFMVRYQRTGNDDWGNFALLSLFASFFAASIANCVARKFFSLIYLGIMFAVSVGYSLALGGITTGILDYGKQDLPRRFPLYLIFAGGTMIVIATITIIVYCRRMGRIHGYFKALDNLEKLDEQMNVSRNKEIDDATANCPEFSEALISDCINTALETY